MDEHAIVERILGAGRTDGAALRVGPGDDAAVLRVGGDLVVSTDLSVEGRHFRLDWISRREAGRRAMSAALSDLAAMGAEPVAVLLSIAGPTADAIAEAGEGARERAAEFRVPVAGGDVSGGAALTLDVGVLGRVPSADASDEAPGRPPWLRSGARPGDRIWVTGRLGAPAAALRDWGAGREPDAAHRARFVDPEPRLAVAARLARSATVTAAIDLSDGLLRDARRMADASGVAIDLDAAAIPVADGTGWTPAEAASAGEEYELLLAAPDLPPDVRLACAAEGCPITEIGRVVAGRGVTLDGEPAPAAGFDHFAPTEG